MSRALATLLLCLALLVPGQVTGQDALQDLVTAGELTLDSSLDSAQALVPGQRALLTIEVATSSWFTGGTRIRIPEVTGLVILQTEQFAANASENRQGKTWVVQRWTLDVYPQRDGDFTIPPITVTLNVNAGQTGSVGGDALAPAITFSVETPQVLEQADFWVASPAFSVSQSVDRDTSTLQPGDAFERRITFESADLQAMMLPEFTARDRPGLAAYPAPPQLENSSNRGETTARRVQTISYVAEAPGSHLLPATDFFWWNTRSAKLEVVSLPAIEVTVAGQEARTEAANTALPRREAIIVGIAGAAATLLGAWLLLRYRPWRPLYRRLQRPLDTLSQLFKNLRRPALPERLNPDSNAAD